MRHKFVFFVATLIVVLLLTYAVTYSVRFNEVAVVTTFGKADESAVHYGSGEPGFVGNLRLKWPYPIQDAKRYDTRVQVLEDRPEEQQTADGKAMIVSTYVAWRIDKPLDFYRSLGSVEVAERQIRDRLRDARSVLGRFTFDDLTNVAPDKLKLADAEVAVRDQLQRQVNEQNYGIAIESVGIKRITLPQTVAEGVFNLMRTTRQQLAQEARSEGESAAAKIKSNATSVKNRILAFAERRAQSIRAQGDAAAAEYYAVFDQNEEFAVFLRWIETARQVLKHNATFVIDAKEGMFEGLFRSPGLPMPQPAGSKPAAAAKP